MPNFRNIFRYMRQYGLKSTVGLVREKLLVDPKRFSPDKKRTLPCFPEAISRTAIPSGTDIGRSYGVLYLLHYFYPEKKGGTERFTLNLAKETAKRGNRPIVLVLDANMPKNRYTGRLGSILYRYYEYEGIRCIGMRYDRAPLGLYYKRISADDVQMKDFARFIIESEGIDAVHATYPQPFAPFLAHCAEAGVPYTVTCTDFALMCHYSTMVDDNGDFCAGCEGGERCARICPTYGCSDFKRRGEAAEELLRGAAYVTVPSKFVANVMSTQFKDIDFIPVNHGISEVFDAPARNNKAKKFVYAGTISRLKGIHLLTEAFGRLVGNDLSLDIYGAGDEKYLQTLKKSADSRVRFHDAVSADVMPKIYGDSDCVVIPSMWYETYNFVLREAASCGALVIAADIGAMSEAVEVRGNGFLFKAGDSNDLYEKLKEAAEFDPQNYKKQTYPKISDEGDIYDRIYRSMIHNAKR